MSFRIATANQFDRTIDQLATRQYDLAKQQERISTGKRVMKASDDPVAATLAESARNRMTRVQADLRALDASRTSLQQAESGLAESGELIQRVRDLLVSAGNPSFADAEREDVARQLEGLREQLLAVANRTDNNGRTLFGGLGGAPTPFVDLYGPSGTGVQFEGQRGQPAAGNGTLPQSLDGDAIWMRIPQGNGSFTLSLPTSNTGGVNTSLGQVTDATALTGDDYRVDFADVGGVIQYTITNTTTGTPVAGHAGVPYEAGKTVAFDGLSFEMNGQPTAGDRIDLAPATGTTDIFSVVQGAIDALRYQGAGESALRTQALGRALTEVDAGHDRVLLARGRAGEWLNRADSMDLLMNNRSTDLELEESRLVDLDMVKGISDFKNKELALNAGLQAYATVQRMSLFDYIK